MVIEKIKLSKAEEATVKRADHAHDSWDCAPEHFPLSLFLFISKFIRGTMYVLSVNITVNNSCIIEKFHHAKTRTRTGSWIRSKGKRKGRRRHEWKIDWNNNVHVDWWNRLCNHFAKKK